MRLPAITVRQAQQEDARQLHDDLYRAYQQPAAGRVFIEVPQTYAAAYAKNLQDALHRFWVKRGYRLRCKRDVARGGFYLWLEPLTGQETAA
jgi:hypothetical protein